MKKTTCFLIILTILASTCTLFGCDKAKKLEYSYFMDDTYKITGVGDAKNIVNLKIPSTYDGKTVNAICGGAFENCTTIQTVTFTDNMVDLRSDCFKGCTALEQVTFGKATEIGSSAFEGCTALTNITMGNEARWIGDCAFKDCTALTNIVFSEALESIGSNAFEGCAALTSVTLPDALWSYPGLDSAAFKNCTALKSIQLGTTLESISYNTFEGCTSLESITIPASVRYISWDAFLGCTSLKSVVFENPEGWSIDDDEEQIDIFHNPELAAEYLKQGNKTMRRK